MRLVIINQALVTQFHLLVFVCNLSVSWLFNVNEEIALSTRAKWRLRLTHQDDKRVVVAISKSKSITLLLNAKLPPYWWCSYEQKIFYIGTYFTKRYRKCLIKWRQNYQKAIRSYHLRAKFLSSALLLILYRV